MDQSPPQRADSADPTHVLREYAVLADGERGILVGPRGDFGWMCFPRWDSPAIFADLLGGGGSYVVTPEGRYVWGGYYEERSLIWNSRWVTENGVIECREALALPTRRDRAVVLRRLSAVAGSPSLRIVLDVRGDYGRAGAGDVHRGDDGTWHIATAGAHLRWSGAPDARVETDSPGRPVLALALRLAEGEQHDLVLDIATDTVVEATASAEDAWARTEAEWRRRVPEIGHTVAPRDAQHSYAVLSGLTSAGGGMVAAATTSLPERANAGRSYDYRYVWIRDQCYAGQAAARAGHPALLDSATRFVQERLLSDGPQLMPAYTTSGGPVPSQTHLGLPGYPGGSDVVGNHVNAQFQLDALGEALLLFAAAARGDRLEADGWQAVQVAIDAIGQRWSEPEAGIWELDPRRWTHSRLICAAGLQAIGRFLDAGNITGPAWRALAGGLVDDATRHGLHPSGRWQRAYDDERVDAALLLAGIRAPSQPCARWRPTSPRTATATGIAPTNVLSVRPRARSCSADSSCRWRMSSRATRCARRAGSSATAPPAAHPGSARRSSTSGSASCAAICRRLSSTPSCWSAPPVRVRPSTVQDSRERRSGGPVTSCRPGTSRVPDILRVGLVAGIAGTAVEACTARLGRRVIGSDSLVYDPARLAARLTRHLAGHTLTDRQAAVMGTAMRWSYGPSWGIAAAAVTRSPSTRPCRSTWPRAGRSDHRRRADHAPRGAGHPTTGRMGCSRDHLGCRRRQRIWCHRRHRTGPPAPREPRLGCQVIERC